MARTMRYRALRGAAWLAWVTACGASSIEPPPPALDPGSADAAPDPIPPPPAPTEDADTVFPQPDAMPPPGDATVLLKRVFATSTLGSGDMGGLAGADARCAAAAAEAGLPGTFVAWASAENRANAVDRVTGDGPWYLGGSGELVAEDAAELVSGVLRHAIDRDERGQPVTGLAWTGSGVTGRYLTNDCDRWTTGAVGRAGDVTARDARWTSAQVVACSSEQRLYCFQQ